MLPSRQVLRSTGLCAPDGYPHSIPYHDSGALSSDTHFALSYQPVAARRLPREGERLVLVTERAAITRADTSR